VLLITGTGRCGSTLLAAYCHMMGQAPGGRPPQVEGGPGFEEPALGLIHRAVAEGDSDRAAALIRGCPRPVVKDPRFVTLGEPALLRAWATHRPDLRVLVLLRDVEAVAASFAARPELFGRGADPAPLAAELRRSLDGFLTALRATGLPHRLFSVLRPDVTFAEVDEALCGFGGLTLRPDAAAVAALGVRPQTWSRRGVWEAWFDPARIRH
jgi:hypothetical protein